MRQEGYYKARYKDSDTVVFYDKVADVFIWFGQALKSYRFQWIDEKPISFKEMPVVEFFKVKIIGCKYPEGWYRNLIGTTLLVEKWGSKEYVVREDVMKGYNAIWRHLDKDDCEVLI